MYTDGHKVNTLPLLAPSQLYSPPRKGVVLRKGVLPQMVQATKKMIFVYSKPVIRGFLCKDSKDFAQIYPEYKQKGIINTSERARLVTTQQSFRVSLI